MGIPSGFPCANRYQYSIVDRVYLTFGNISATHSVADGAKPEIKKPKVLSSAAPNFVHSMDAAHLALTINAAVQKGIRNVLTVHDCYYCLAPQVESFRNIILWELWRMYQEHDPLRELWERNRNDTDPPPPNYGTLDRNQIPSATNAFI